MTCSILNAKISCKWSVVRVASYGIQKYSISLHYILISLQFIFLSLLPLQSFHTHIYPHFKLNSKCGKRAESDLAKLLLFNMFILMAIMNMRWRWERVLFAANTPLCNVKLSLRSMRDVHISACCEQTHCYHATQTWQESMPWRPV